MALAVDLGDGLGRDNMAKRLTALAGQTRGKPVTLVVQTQAPPDPSAPDRLELRRFVIRDGVATPGPAGPSRGLAEDLKALMRAAGQHPADRLGLVINSHGKAGEGLGGDAGAATLREVETALKDGLAYAGRPGGQLDLLDFDACLMGQREVLARMAHYAAHVVASAEMEFARRDVVGRPIDGQDLDVALGALLAAPELDGAGLAEAFVDAARSGVRVQADGARAGVEAEPAEPGEPPEAGEATEPPEASEATEEAVADEATEPAEAGGPPALASGTLTLAHYDMAAMPALAQAIDGLGDALAAAAAGPGARQALRQAVAEVRAYGEDDQTDQRDLRPFMAAVERLVGQGAVPDEGGRLAGAIAAVRAAEARLVASSYGAPPEAAAPAEHRDFRGLGGLGVYLPADDFGAAERDAIAAITFSARHREDLAAIRALAGQPGGLTHYRDSTAQVFEAVATRIEAVDRAAAGPLRAAIRQIETARDAAELGVRAEAAVRRCDALAKDPAIAAKVRGVVRREQREALAKANAWIDTGWGRFIAALHQHTLATE